MPARIHLVTGRDLNVDDDIETIVEALAIDGRAAVRQQPGGPRLYVFLAGVAYVAPASG
jgi:hypothetical protein